MGGSCDIPNIDCEQGKPKWLAKETQKKCHIKLFRLPQGQNSVTLSESAPWVYPYVLCSIPPNKHFICFTTFCLCGNSFLQSQEARVLSLTTGLVVRIWCSHRRDPDSISGRWAQTLLQTAADWGPPEIRSGMATQEFGKSRETTGFAQLSLTAPDFYSCLLSLISPSLSFQESNNSWVIVVAVLCDKVETQFPTEQEPKSSLSLSCSHCLSLTVLCETLHYSFLSHFPPTQVLFLTPYLLLIISFF